jgi:hypothetical protein
VRKLAIVGSHPTTRENAPFEDPDYEIWLFNEAPQKPEVYRRWDNSFQMHKPEVYSSHDNWVNKDHWDWLQQDHGDKIIWMMDYDERVPNSKRYPLEEVLSLVPYHYLRSTPAMALALAIHLGYEHIALYGSELSSNTEYGYQAVNYAFWIGFAHGRGIDLRMECWQSEFNQPLYGYEGELQIPRDFFQLRIDDLATADRVNKKSMQKIEQKMNEAMMDFKIDKVAELSLNLESMALKAGEAAGALAEAYRYHERTQPISRQEFERVCAQAQMDGDKSKDEMNHLAGICEYVYNVWAQTGNGQALGQLRDFMRKRTEQAFETGRQLGIFRENAQYMSRYDEYVTAAGGVRAVSQAEKVLV